MHKFDINVFALKTLTIANPAAGADFVIPAISGQRMELLAVTFTYDTSGAVGNRLVHVHHVNDGNDTQGSTAPGNLVANELIDFEISQGMENTDLSASSETMLMTLPHGIFIGVGDTFESEVVGILALDQISDIKYRVKIWYSL